MAEGGFSHLSTVSILSRTRTANLTGSRPLPYARLT